VAAFDLVGVGLNSTDTLLLVPNFPAYGGKVRIVEEVLSPGGQVASALTAAAKLGLKTKYIGTIGDDVRGEIQMLSLEAARINLDDVEIRKNCPNQSAYIVIDQATGERTVFWSRPDCLELDPARITPDNIACARMLHIDGHDTKAVEKAARVAREHGIPVSCDVDTIYPGFDRVLPLVDYLVSSSEFPARWTGERDPFKALEIIQNEHKMRVAAMTLGADGALALVVVEGVKKYVYVPGFVVDCIDTTGAGDVFHGAFCYAVINGMAIQEGLEFSCAMAALNCTKLGARGGIATANEAWALMQSAERRVWSEAHRVEH
jgi:sugar/nucleoside kinase (ribokinase family)